ncbi:MAG: hypothetical protein AB1346_00050 [Thermodesulfobacteriota bacterium]
MIAPMRDKDRVELSVLKRFCLRYSVLAAWQEDLRGQGIMIPASVSKPLERVRVKISSGCFPACDVGCDLGRIEAILFSTATTAGLESADSWVDTLGECMAENAKVEEIEGRIKLPSVKMHYNRFKFDGGCGSCGAVGNGH